MSYSVTFETAESDETEGALKTCCPGDRRVQMSCPSDPLPSRDRQSAALDTCGGTGTLRLGFHGLASDSHASQGFEAGLLAVSEEGTLQGSQLLLAGSYRMMRR